MKCRWKYCRELASLYSLRGGSRPHKTALTSDTGHKFGGPRAILRSTGCTFRVPHSYPQVWEFSKMTHRIHYAYDYSFLKIIYSKRIQIKTSQRKSRLGWILGGSQKGCFHHPQGHVTHPASACGHLRRALPHWEIDPGSWFLLGLHCIGAGLPVLVELHFQPPPLWRLGW